MSFRSIIPSRLKSSRPKVDMVLSIGVAFPGRREVIEVKASDTVLTLKGLVEEKMGIPVSDQQLLYNNKILKDHRTLKHYKVENDRTLMLQGDHSEYIKARPTDPTLQRLSKQIENGTIQPRSPSKVDPKKLQNDALQEVPEDDTVLEITIDFNVKIGNKIVEGLTIGKQRSLQDMAAAIQKSTKFGSLENHIICLATQPEDTRDSLLDNPDTTVGEADGIEDGVLLEIRALNVTFKVSLPNGEVVSMEFDRDADINELVSSLNGKGFESEHPLKLMREGDVLPESGKTLRDLGIVTGSYLDFKPEQQDGDNEVHLTVEWKANSEEERDSGKLSVMFDCDEELWELMKQVEEAGGGHAQRMTLVDESGNELDEEGSLRDFGIVGGSAVLQVMAE